MQICKKIYCEAVTDVIQSYQFKDNSATPTLTLQEKVESVFPNHRFPLQSGQILIDQTFSFPRFIELSYLSVAAHRKRIAKQFSSTGLRDRWTK